MPPKKGSIASAISSFGENIGLIKTLTINIPAAGAANELNPPINHIKSDNQTSDTCSIKENEMALDISKLSDLKGFIGACLVDSDTGLTLATEGGGKLDLDTAGAANVEVVRAKLQAIEALKLNDVIEDILITLGKQYHLIRPLEKNPTIFVYVALDKKTANLGLARLQVKAVEENLSL